MTVIGAPRRLLVSLRDRGDEYLHPRRRASAKERLVGLQPRVCVFVCLGNVCRSPYAARVAAATDRVSVDSAGFIGPDRSPPDAALRVALERGLDHSDHRSKILTPELANRADALFVLDRYNVARMRAAFPQQMNRTFWLGDFDPIWSGKRAIIDPWGKNDVDFHSTFERIERCLASLLNTLDGKLP